ncbi:hypothetical protein F9K33_16425 [bacterium]|nr:MAG: hypothetical protein F9K33_16425 [bacterium]
MKHLRAILLDRRMVALWSMDYLQLVQRIMNAQIHETIGVTPSELLFGKAIPSLLTGGGEGRELGDNLV